MILAIKAEFRKLFTTRMWWILALVMLSYLAVLSFGMASLFTLVGGDDLAGAEREIAIMVYSLASPLGYVFPLLIGSLLFTGEYRHKTITSSLLVAPNRSVLLAAKLVVGLIVGALFGVVAVLAVVSASAPLFSMLGEGAYLGETQVLQMFLATVVVFMLWSMLGVALGGFIVNQIAAIVVILAVTQFIEPILSVGLMFWDAGAKFGRFLPGSAGGSVVGESFMGMDPGMATAETLTRVEGALVLLVYIAFFAILARIITLRRDVG